MTKEISTRDALLQLRRVVAEDAKRSVKLKKLDEERAALQAEKSAALTAGLATLEGYVALHSRLHGFSGALEDLVVETEEGKQPVRKRAVTGRVTEGTRTEVAPPEREFPTRRIRATGYPSTLDETISLSGKEQDFVNTLMERWPLFTTPKFMVRKGVIPAPHHVTAKVNQLRKKGVPIESARQARQADGRVSPKARGYRLIG